MKKSSGTIIFFSWLLSANLAVQALADRAYSSSQTPVGLPLTDKASKSPQGSSSKKSPQSSSFKKSPQGSSSVLVKKSSALKGKTTGIRFDEALPEDISNANFPDQINSFDFPDASLLDLVKAIGKLTQVNFIIDPGLRGKKVSIIAPSPITVAEAYKAFLSALAANGYTVVKSGAFWKIQTVQKAHKDNIEVYSGDYFPNTDQLITRVIKLKHLNAKDFMASVKHFLSQDNKQISVLESSNSLILSDYGSVIERVMKIVYEMDVPGSEEGIEIIPIQHASADYLAGILGQILDIGSSRSSYGSSYLSRTGRKSQVVLSPSSRGGSGGSLKISKILPDNRTSSLVVSANKEGVKRVRSLIKKLDTPVDAGRTGGIYVYNVLYGTAIEVYNTLMGIKPSDKGKKKERSHFFPTTGRRLGGSYSSGAQSPLFENVTILADANTNSLIISAKNKYDYEKVLSVLRKIDIPRDQVFIQAIIVEMIIDKNDDREFNLAGALGQLLGKNSFIEGIGFKDILGTSVAGFLSRSIDLASLLQKPQFGPGLILGAPVSSLLKSFSGRSSAFGMNVPDIITDHFEGMDNQNKNEITRSVLQSSARSTAHQNLQSAYIPLIRLLKRANNINVLSTPQLTTLDNVPAFIEVGENAPVGLTSTATAGALSQNSVDRQNVTLRLDIVPRINPESGTVQLDIKQKFDDFSNRSPSASELAARSVNIIKRNIETKMVLSDGETAVLGGLLTDREVRLDNKVPLLGDIPLIGWLFKGSSVKKEKRNLLVFITPTIIKGEKHEEKTEEILGQKLAERIHFIKKYMRGKDPHGEILNDLIPESKSILKKQKRKKSRWFWQRDSDAEGREAKNSPLVNERSEPSVEREPFLPEEEFVGEIEEGAEIIEGEEIVEELRPADYEPALLDSDLNPSDETPPRSD